MNRPAVAEIERTIAQLLRWNAHPTAGEGLVMFHMPLGWFVIRPTPSQDEELT